MAIEWLQFAFFQAIEITPIGLIWNLDLISRWSEGGREYEIEFWVRHFTSSDYAGNLGISFSSKLIRNETIDALNLSADINFAAAIKDDDWVCLRRRFVATHEAEYIIIGNFYDKQQTEFSSRSSAEFKGAFYFLDKLSLVEVP